MKSVLILCETDLSKDPRVLRQIEALKDNYEILTCGLQPSGYEKFFFSIYPVVNYHFNYTFLLRKLISGFIQLASKIRTKTRPLKLLILKATFKKMYYESLYWNIHRKRIYNNLAKQKFDIILANDLDTLPLAARLKNGKVKLVFDAHEYSPGEYDSNLNWVNERKGQVVYFCEEYFPFVDLMFCVGYSIAEEYRKNFRVNPIVITNATNYADIEPVKCKGFPIRLIHHGICARDRHLELMIEATKMLDERFTLDLMLVPSDEGYLEELKKMVVAEERVKFIEPVVTSKIPRTLNPYDAGIIFIPPVNFNYRFCLPNKFYESIQGRIALILGPTKDMVDISSKYSNAVVTKGFTALDLYDVIKALTVEDINRMKIKSDICAKEINANENKKVILQKINELQ